MHKLVLNELIKECKRRSSKDCSDKREYSIEMVEEGIVDLSSALKASQEEVERLEEKLEKKVAANLRGAQQAVETARKGKETPEARVKELEKVFDAVESWAIGHKANKLFGRTRPGDDYLFKAFSKYTLSVDTEDSKG